MESSFKREVSVNVDSNRITIGEAGVWVDHMEAGKITRSQALAWEELTTEECVLYIRLYRSALAADSGMVDEGHHYAPLAMAG